MTDSKETDSENPTAARLAAMLAEQEERFRLAIACMGDGLWDWRMDADVVYFSARYKAMLGYAETQFPNRLDSFTAHLHPDDRPAVMDLARRFIEGATHEFDTVFRMRHRSGHYLWIRSRAVAARDGQGRARRLVGSHSDITAEREAELALAEQEHFLRLVLDNMPQAIFWKGLDNRYRGCNTAYLKLVGRTDKAQVVNRCDADFYGPAMAEGFEAEDRRLMDHNQPLHRHTEQLTDRDGAERWMETTKIPLTGVDGRVLGLLGITETVTDRVEAGRVLREYNQRLEAEVAQRTAALARSEALLDTCQTIAGIGGWETDLITGEQRWTRNTREIFELPEDFEPTLERTLAMIDPDTPAEALERRSQAVAARQSFDVEMLFITTSGRRIIVRSVGNPVVDENGEVTRYVGILKDVTAERAAERALIQARDEAEQARREAEIANHAKSTFLANMSHELRTPLNGILGYAQILQRERDLRPRQQEGLETILRSGEYLLTLINDVLDLARIESNRIELYLTDFSLAEFLESIAGLFRMRAEQKGIAFLYEPLTALPVGVRGDEKRLRQVLINLLSNAVKFTDSGGVALKVGYHQDRLRFQVEDTGLGIDEEDLAHIFEPFRQVGDRRYRADGAGLGLAITRTLVELMGGEIQVSSQPDRGSLFWFALDLPTVDTLLPRERERPPVIVGYQGERRRILVIDDRSENRSVLRSLLTPLGFELLEASDGEVGLKLAIQEHPDLVLTDLVMPVLDGFEVVRRLRRDRRTEDLPVIAVTASVFDHHQTQSFAVGCNAFIPKPIRAEHLLEAIREQLGLNWLTEAALTGSDASAGADHDATPAPLRGPDPARAGELVDLARQGDVSGVEALLAALAADPALGAFVTRARELVAEFQLEEVEAMALPWLDGDSPGSGISPGAA